MFPGELIGKLLYLVVVEIRLHELFRLVRMLAREVRVESVQVFAHSMHDRYRIDAAFELLFAGRDEIEEQYFDDLEDVPLLIIDDVRKLVPQHSYLQFLRQLAEEPMIIFGRDFGIYDYRVASSASRAEEAPPSDKGRNGEMEPFLLYESDPDIFQFGKMLERNSNRFLVFCSYLFVLSYFHNAYEYGYGTKKEAYLRFDKNKKINIIYVMFIS